MYFVFIKIMDINYCTMSIYWWQWLHCTTF